MNPPGFDEECNRPPTVGAIAAVSLVIALGLFAWGVAGLVTWWAR